MGKRRGLLRVLVGAVVALVLLSVVALVAHEEPAPTRLATAPVGVTSTSLVLETTIPTAVTDAVSATSAAVSPQTSTTARVTPRATSTSVATSAPTTTVPMGQPITFREGTDAHYTAIEGTGCVGEGARAIAELYVGDQMSGEDGNIARPDGTWSVPMSPPAGRYTVRARCLNIETGVVYVTYPDAVHDFT